MSDRGPARRLLILAALGAAAALSACAGAPTRSGFLSSYDRLQPNTRFIRAETVEIHDAEALALVRRISLRPTVLSLPPDAQWMTPKEQALLLAEVDAQLCYELAERYQIVEAEPDATVRAAITAAAPTSRMASAASAVANYYIPGPGSVRAPGLVGALSGEAEMVAQDGKQTAAISWTRAAMPVGLDSPSLSRVGDAMQLANPFADATAKAMVAPGVKPIKSEGRPCARYGPRLRLFEMAFKFATGLHIPTDRRPRPLAEGETSAP